MTAPNSSAVGRLSVGQAMHIAELTIVLATPDALRRIRDSLPPRRSDWPTVARHTIADEEGYPPVIKGARAQIEALLGPCGPDVRQAVGAAAAVRVGSRSYEEVVLGLGLAAADLYVIGRVAERLGVIGDLFAGHEHVPRIRELFGQAMEDLSIARMAVVRAVRLLNRMPRTRLFPSKVEWAARSLSRLAGQALPAFDGSADRRRRPGELWCKRIEEAIWALEVAFSLPQAPAWPPPPPSDAEAAALAEILARPDDTEARLRWAELAEARGAPQAALVRTQVEVREKVRDWPSLGRSEPRRSRLLIEWHSEWAAAVGRLGAQEVAFRRGFVEWVSIDAGTFLRRAPELFAVAPILYVKLTGVAPLLPDVLASGLLSRLLALDLSGEGLDDDHVAAIAGASGLTRLRSLNLRSNPISAIGLAHLYTTTTLPSLVHCDLDGTLCGQQYELGWTAQEYPTEEWLATPLLASLEANFGRRAWTTPYRTPPDFDALTVLIDPQTGRPPTPPD
ncbi:hypothetical protein [Acrocarpospora catenulata]|uniref:hypothetical protein n=1 Tax=Acrocarpospora catenulata TaxID=2836182 RepID=UPI001BD9E9DE|nr:hypothetical protein [Acrocarpospora catenulata]